MYTALFLNKAIYTTALVTCGWAGAVWHLCPKTRSDYGRTDQPTDRHSDVKSCVHATKNEPLE